MSKFEEGMKILNERFGNNKDNVISLATISLEQSEDGKPRPCVRDVDAYYEDGVFYIVTYALSNKVKQISANPEVSISVNFEDFFSSGIGKNLGWVLDPSNAQIRDKLRIAFKDWYDFANNENDKNCCFLAIYLTKGTLRIDHGAEFYHFDFENKSAT
ncbi:pyridoxamine 5'-phosphate oxidase family protein [Candidatus Galacturonibacter soehngenii]|uniref:Pyridoxamine 5'-phosphate oxidase family protein n=1 Tax=Candidatus Galacturonatibacter soehngenii TaxID=2307010 RepID=A0A7V7QL56_9FIRM|nr:pyridoxamine 5'-phosphate oxidase family protein [Candidatus Galacturonibacter soehngenii]KAB1438687.1 pyridoxamine 5'-phosphate oxidase family protein [Candidatus Galacturonibacter soehngenii]